MNDILLKNYSFIVHSVEFLAAITGLFVYKKYKYSNAKYFIWFLWYLSICDTLGVYSKYVKPDQFLNFLIGTLFQKNYWWATLFWGIGAILFYSFYYYKILKNKSSKRFLKLMAVCFFIFSATYIIFNIDEYFVRYLVPIDIFGALIIFSCTLLYFIETLNSDKILTFYRSLNFYISIAVFIWWLIITPLVFYDIYNSQRDWNFIFLKWQIYLFANTFMYSTFTFALIWCKPEND